jgi:hypothetical protein
MRLEGIDKLIKIHLIGDRTRDLPAYSIVPQPTTLPRTPIYIHIFLTSALAGGEWSVSRPGRFTPGTH